MARNDIRPSKRRKVDQNQEQPTPDIRGAFELHDLLRFQQSTSPEVKSGIDQFKNFLSSIQRNEDPSDKSIQLKVLKQYCDQQSSSTKNDLDFPDLLSTWSFAAQSNAELILSAVPATLAQFFRTVSGELGFREFGLSLSHSLLKREQLRLIDGGLSAPKFKEFLISPCLRLLTEIASFDGGASAGNVFSRRDILLRRLDALLDTVPRHEDGTDRRRPTVRRNAQRLLLALLKYLDTDSKAELVSQGKVLHSCLRKLNLDGGDIIRDLLQAFRRDIIDTDLPKQIKSRFLNPGNLGFLAGLYDFESEDVDREDSTQQVMSVREAVHHFLLHVCTARNGILLPQSGWYPLGFDFDASTRTDDEHIELGLDSPYYFDQYATALPIKNTNLSTLIQCLRPDRDTLQAELLVKIFEAAPELVADYFVKRPKSTASTKDETRWRGHFAFIFSVINLPVPKNCGWHDGMPSVPPPTSVMVESVLPRPLDRSTITQYLSSNDDVIVMSAARLVTTALTKLENIQKLFKSVASTSDLWNQAASKLSELIASRAPTYHDFVSALQRTPKDQVNTRGALLECVAMYNKVLPVSTAGSKFDVGPVMTDVMNQLLDESLEDDRQDELSFHLISLVQIASLSTVRWWHKPNPHQLSPFVNLVKVFVTSPYVTMNRTVTKVIRTVLYKTGIIRSEDTVSEALIASFHGQGDGEQEAHIPQSMEVYLFAENCMMRTSKQPVKYLDQLEAAQKEASDDTPLSLLPCCVIEQWPYALKTSDSSTVKDLAAWVARLFALLEVAGENRIVLSNLFRRELLDQTGSGFKMTLAEAFTFQDDHPECLPRIANAVTVESEQRQTPKEQPKESSSIDLVALFPPPSPPPSSLRGLTNWTNPDFESELAPPIASSRLARLICCLSSSLEEVRLQALQTLKAIMDAVSSSIYSEKDQVYLVLGEVCETARQHALIALAPSQSQATSGDATKHRERDPALPTIVTSLAAIFLSILTNPADKMYSKANRFLMRSPTWTPVTRVIPYLVDQILHREPEYDEPFSWEAEVTRFLDLLVSGLRTEQDMELYRKSDILERLGSLYFSPAVGGKVALKKKVLHVVSNAMEIEGGVDTLITRAGVRAWFEIVVAREGRGSELGRIVEALKKRMEERCSKSYIQKWEEDRPVFRDVKSKQQDHEMVGA